AANLTCHYPSGGCGVQCSCSGGVWSCVADPCAPPLDAGPPAAAELCTQTGGTVVQTYCSANPPFAQYTCARGENGAVCAPAPGDPIPMTPERNVVVRGRAFHYLVQRVIAVGGAEHEAPAARPRLGRC